MLASWVIWIIWFAFIWYDGGLGVLLSSNAGPVPIIITLVLLYWVGSFITLYFSAAMLIAYRSFISGKQIGMAQAFRQTMSLFPNLFEWSFIYAVLITIIEVVRSLLKGWGRFIFDLAADISIAAATFFVLPIIVEENESPMDAIEDSADLLTKNFGLSFGGFVSINVYANIFMFVGFLIALLSFMLYSSGVVGFSLGLLYIPINAYIVGIGFAIGAALFIYGEVVGGAMMTLFRMIVYDYAIGRKLPPGIDEQLIKEAVREQSTPNIIPPIAPGAEIDTDYIEEDLGLPNEDDL